MQFVSWATPQRTAVILAGLVFVSCKGDGPFEEDLAGEKYAAGQEVQAKYPTSGKLKKGKIHEIYGRAALITFSNRRRHLVNV